MARANIYTRLEPEALRPGQEIARFMEQLAGDGALVSFVGIARPINKAGKQVTGLFLDHYPGMTEKSLEDIAAAAIARFAVSSILIVHRCGNVAPGEPIVIAAASAGHRRAAFAAADYLMDRLKIEAVFWKREDGIDETIWIEPTDEDRADRARWSDQE